MEKQFNLLIDTKRTGFNTVRGLKQGDNNSVLDITLVQNSIPFDLTDLTIRINYKRPDNKIFLQIVDVVNAAEGKIKVNILTKALETAGEIKSDLSVFDKDNRKITSATFSMFVDASIYGNDYIEPEDLDLIQQIYSEEEKRIRQENEREINEKTRQSNENIRIENENVRKDRELERIRNEELRQENENIRVNKENERITQENERVESETIRQEKENQRTENERIRQANEEKRQRDEITRQQNEENRKQTQLDMQKVITNINEIEPYETSKTYNKLNRATYNGSSYEAVKDVPINTPPTNTMYWICIAEKGKDGKGSGNMHTDVYDKNNDGIVDVAETANNVDWSNIQNKPDLSQMSKVQSVNDKTGAVVLNAEDIKTNSGENVESQLADMTQQIENIDLSADKIKIADKNNKFNSTEVEGALYECITKAEEAFIGADNGKKNWVDVIGSPLLNTDSFSTLKSKTQNLKNTFASNLNDKKVSASGTEGLSNLINKIKNIDMNSPFSISFPEVEYITEITYIDRDAQKYYLKQKYSNPFNTMEVDFNGTVLKFYEYRYQACTFCPWGFLEVYESNPTSIRLYNYPNGTKIAELEGKSNTTSGNSNARVIKVNGAYYAFICSSSYNSSYVLLKDANNTILLSGEVNDEYTDRDAEVICDVKTKCFVATVNKSCFAVDFNKKELIDFSPKRNRGISATSLSIALGLGLNI